MRAKVLSVIIIIAICAYINFGLILQQPVFGDPSEIYSAFEIATVIICVIFGSIGVCATDWVVIRWILK